MIKWVVPYRTGGPYTLEDVIALEHNIRLFYTEEEVQFVVYSDDMSVGLYCNKWVPLKALWSRKHWSVQECFREHGPVFFTGLDTVLAGRIDALFIMIHNLAQNEFLMMHPFNKKYAAAGGSASGVMGWTGNQEWLFDTFPDGEFDPNGKEQARTNKALLKRGYMIHHAQDYQDGIISYKKEYAKDLSDTASLIVFHGEPRPSEVWDEKIIELRGTLK